MVNYYVAKNGSNANDGSLEHPFADIAYAKRKAAVWLNNGEDVTVNVRGGEYLLTESVTFGEGELVNGRRITVAAYGNERVSLIGGIRIEKERFSPATDEEKAALIDREAAKNLMRIDLSDMKEHLYPIRSNLDKTYLYTALFVGGRTMWHARYPKRDIDADAYTYGPYLKNLGFKYATEAKNKSVKVLIDTDTMKRVKGYSEKSRSDMWINGFPAAEWSDESHRIVGIDDELCALLTDETPFRYAPSEQASDKRYYLFNIFEELSTPNEYYIDYERGYVYTCVKDGNIPEDMYLGTLNTPLISVSYGGNVTLKGLDLLYSHSSLMTVASSSGVIIDSCTVAHSPATGVRIHDSSSVKILNSEIYDLGRGGVIIWRCGERMHLNSAGILIDNCIMHDVDNLYQCYNPCICVRYHTCGVKITHSTFYNATHNLINLGCNSDIEVAYNELYNGCTDTSDSSVIYWGRDPSTLGYTVHDNYFHHCMCEWAKHGTAVIYMDDSGTGAEIYNNVMYKCGSHNSNASGIIKGTVFHRTRNNIFIELDDKLEQAGVFGWQDWILACMGAYSFESDSAYELGNNNKVNHWFDVLARAGFFSESWRRKYKGTFWQKLYDLLPLSLIGRVDEFRSSVKGDPVPLQNAKIKHFCTNLVWSHRFADGTPCEEEDVYECMQKHFPEDYAKALSEVEGQDEAARYFRLAHLVTEMYWFKKFDVDLCVWHDTNLCIALPERYLDEHGKPVPGIAIHENNFNMPDDKMPNGESVFVDYGKDFTLTPAGLAYVQSKINGFSPIDTSVIGAKR